MNEPSNFLDGAFNGCPNTPLENPQYVPGAGNDPLKHKTVCMSAKQYAGLHYDVHNLYGFTEAIATNV
jgi:lysosomal alpha-glucosidase